MNTIEVPIEELKKDVEEFHKCPATWVEAVNTVEKFEDGSEWKGVVQVFALEGHPNATRCYAWRAIDEAHGSRDLFAILGVGNVSSASAAVRSAMLMIRRHVRRGNTGLS